MSRSPGDGKVALKKQLTSVSKDLAIHGIHVDLLAIRQEVRSGRLQWKTVVAELLDLNKRNMDALENGSLGGLSKDLEGLVTLVGKACGDKGVNCGGLDKIKDGITAMETIDSTALGGIEDAVKVGSHLRVLKKLKDLDIEALKKLIKTLQSNLEAAPKDPSKVTEMNRYSASIKNDPIDLLEALRIFSSKFTSEELAKLTEESLKSATSAVLDAKPVSDLVETGKAVDSMRNQLVRLKNVTSQLQTTFSDDLPKNMRARVATLSDTVDREKLVFGEKTATHGFPGGFEDLKNVPVNAKSSFVKDSGTNEQGEKILKELVTFAFVLEKEVEPFLKISHPDGAAEVIQLAEKLVKQLELARSEISELGGFSELQKCAEIIDEFAKVVDMEKWTDEKVYIDKMKDGAVAYANAFNNITVTTTEIEKFGKAVENIDLKVQTDFVSTYAQKDALLAELEEFSKQLEKLDIKELIKWAKNSEIDVLLQSLDGYLQKNELSSLQNCFTTGVILEAAKKSIGDRSTMSAVLNVNSGNKNFIGAGDLEKMVLELSTAWIQKFASNNAIPITGDVPMFPDPLKISRDASAAINYLLGLAAAADEQFNLEEFQRNEKAILASFDTLETARRQKYTALLNDEMIRIKNLLKFLKDVDQILIKVPRHLSDYKEVFEAMGSLSELSNHQLKQLMDACVQSGSPFPSKKVRERLKMLDLNFANGQTVMKNGLTAFNLTIPYFVDPVSNTVSIAPNSASTSSLPPDSSSGFGKAELLYTIAGCVAVGAVCVGTGFGVQKWLKARDQKQLLEKRLQYLTGSDGSVIGKLELGDKPKMEACDLYPARQPTTEKTKTNETIKNLYSQKFVTALAYQEVDLKCKQKQLQDEIDLPPVGSEENEIFKFPKITDAMVKKMMKFGQKQVTIDPNTQKLTLHRCEKEFLVGKEHDKFAKSESENAQKRDEPDKAKKNLLKKSDILLETLNKKVQDSLEELGKILRKPRDPAGEDVQSGWRKLFGCTRRKKKESPGDENHATCETKNEATVESGVENDANVESDIKLYNEEIEYENYLRRKNRWDPRGKPNYTREVNIAHVERNNGTNALGCDPEREDNKGTEYVRKLITLMLQEKFIAFEYPPLHYEKNENKVLEKFDYHLRRADLVWILEKATALFNEDLDEGHPTISLEREEIMLVGDIHGQYRDLCYHLTMEFMNKKITFVFLGDLPDRGPRSMDVIILVCLLKIANPKRFYWLRGNHETLINMEYGFLLECRRNLGHWCGTEFWMKSNDLFQNLPIYASLQGKVYAAHGGLPREMLNHDRESLKEYVHLRPNVPKKVQFQEHILWIDPATEYFNLDPNAEPTAYLKCNKRGMPGLESMTELGVNAVMKKHGYVFAVRGHEVQPTGVGLFSGNAVVTTYGSTDHSNNNKASHLIINKNLDVRIVRFKRSDVATVEEDQKTRRE